MTHRLVLALALTAVFGAWEMLFADFMADDLMQLVVLEGLSPAAARTGPFDLYTLSDGNPAHVQALKDAGLPWFFDPSFKMAFCRPLASALLALDHAVFGLHPAGYRLHGVLWSLLLVAAVGMIAGRVLSGRLATLALFVFVLSGIQGIFCWTAARHVVVAAALGTLALAAHLRWRQDAWRPGGVLSVVLLVLSLAASEAGMAVAAYLFAYEVYGASDAVRVRLRAAAPALVVIGIYALLWRTLGYGASPGSDYLDPLRAPGTFLYELPGRLAVLIGGVVLGGNADVWVLRPDLRWAIAAAGGLVSLAGAALLRAVWRDIPAADRRALRWLGSGMVVSAVPFAGTPIGSRCLLVPLIGGAALIAVVIEHWWTTWRRSKHYSRTLRAAGAGVAVMHLGLAPLGRLTAPVLLPQMLAGRAAAAVRDAEVEPATMTAQTAVVLVAPDFIVGLHAIPYRLLHRLPIPNEWHVLSWGRAAHRFVRTGADTLEMEVDGAGIGRVKLTPGAVVTVRGMEATVLAAGSPAPTRVRFRFDRPLDAPLLTLLIWRDGRLRRVSAPPVGDAIAGVD